jgi:hypothetical protein
MKSLELIEIFVEGAISTQNLHKTLAKQYCLEILQEKGATSKENAISFKEDDDKPCVNSCNCITTDDVASAEVIRVWCDGDFIYADLDFYYQQSWTEDVLLDTDYEFDWITLLGYLKYII